VRPVQDAHEGHGHQRHHFADASAEAAIPVLAGLFLEITSPVIALMIGSFLLHDMTAQWDVSYAVTLREVTPIEQHVHSSIP